jgi:parvulin-like peptidyl-prolyl isomerase
VNVRGPVPRFHRSSWILILTLLAAAGCGQGLPPDAVAVYDGGSITAAEAERYLGSLDRRRLRTDAAVDTEQGLTDLLGELAFLEILAAEAGDLPAAPAALYLDPRGSLVVSYYIERTGKRSHEVSDEEALAFYHEHLTDRFTVPEAVKFQHIFLRSDRHPPQELEGTVRTILDQLADGTPFSELVAAYSESGSTSQAGVVGPVYRGRMDPSFEEPVYRLAPGKLSAVSTPTGVHIVEVLEKHPPEATPYEAVKPQIVNAIMDRRNQVEREQLLATLRSHHGVVDRSGDPTLQPDDVALQVGDREMTKRQLDTYLAARTMSRGPMVGAEQNLSRQLVDDLVSSNLLYLDAVERGLDREQTFIDRWDLRELRRKARLAQQRRLDAWAESVGDEEALMFYQDNQARFALPQRFQASYVQMSLGGGPPFALQQELEKLAELAAAPGTDQAELEQRCAEAGAVYVDMGWVTPVDAGHVGPEFQRRLLAMSGPGSTSVFRDEGWLFAILVRAVEARRPLILPADHDLIRARYVVLRRSEILAEIKKRLLEERHFVVLSTAVFKSTDAQG